MYRETGNETTMLILFAAFLGIALVTLAVAWAKGRQWGDLSSRKHYGEALNTEERKTLSHSRRDCLIWAAISLTFTFLAFLMLR